MKYYNLRLIRKENINSPLSMWLFIQENNIIATFSNLNIILRIYLTLPISTASAEDDSQ